jgi:hypothetical protein
MLPSELALNSGTTPTTVLTPPPTSSIANTNAISLPNSAPVTPPPPGGLESITGKQMMAASAPLGMPVDQKPAAIPVDDEMYYTEYTPAQSGKRSDTSTEVSQISGRYSPIERIKADDYQERRNRRYFAAQGGLMGLAEGGETTAAAPEMTASEAALAYLMGERASSAMGQPAVSTPDAVAVPDPMEVASDRMYSFNPATGAFTKNPNYRDPADQPSFPWLLSGLMGNGYNAFDDPRFGDMNRVQVTDSGGSNAAEGGLVGLAKGGMASGGFVVPADVVSMVGEGNTDAGYKRIKSMIPGATAIKGKDGGQADTVKTNIDGKQPARVAHGEMYIPPATVKRMGGAKKLYAMMDRVRAQATGSTKQIRPVSLKKAMA